MRPLTSHHDTQFRILAGIFYEDLYHTTKFLPTYALPAGMPSNVDLATELASPKAMAFRHQQTAMQRTSSADPRRGSFSGGVNHRPPPGLGADSIPASKSDTHLPFPATSPGEAEEKSDFVGPSSLQGEANGRRAKQSLAEGDGALLPSRIPPKYSYFDIFPFSLLVKLLVSRG